jgi:hypothetical protein
MDNQICISSLIEKFEKDVTKYPDILEAIFVNVKPLTENIHSILKEMEDLKLADDRYPQSTTPLAADPKTQIYCKEIIAWALSILASAWTQWVFTSKSMEDSDYQTDPNYDNDPDRQAARFNVKKARPYIHNSILDTIDAATKIGSKKEYGYRPNSTLDPIGIKLRKD